VIDIPDQPLAQRILRAALDRPNPPQQLLFYGPPGTGKREAARRVAWGLIDPTGTHGPNEASMDLTIVAASGAAIRLQADLDPALADLAARPSVGLRRVLIIDGAERLSEREGAPRILKQLEEPPPRSHVILVTDHVSDLLPTIRSRCLPVPFRSPGWRHIAGRLEGEGLSSDAAAGLARADGAAAISAGPFDRAMRLLGVDMAERALRGDGAGSTIVREIQAQMAAASDGHPSDELIRLRAEAELLAGKRGERTAIKKADDQEKRERRRALTDGWAHVLDGAAGLVADALAVAVGTEESVRHRDRMETLRTVGVPSRAGFLERALDEIQLTRSEMELNPTLDLAMEGLLARIAAARRGESAPLVGHGRLPW
jgi:DNA polymerase III subunit delta'